MAVVVKASKDSDGVVRLALLAVRMGEGADFDEVLAAHPWDQVEQMYPYVENDAALRKVLAPRRPRFQAGSAFDGERGEPSEPPGAHDLAHMPDGGIEPKLVRDAQDHAGVAAGSDHLARVCH